jgi:hypothetical protein
MLDWPPRAAPQPTRPDPEPQPRFFALRTIFRRAYRTPLAAAKARGVKLGGYRHDGSISKAEALDQAEALRSTFDELRDLSH